VVVLPADDTQRRCPTKSEQRQVQNDQVTGIGSIKFQLFVALGPNVASKSLCNQALNDKAIDFLFILDE